MLAVSGNVLTNSLTDDTVLITNSVLVDGGSPDTSRGYPGITRYPANFTAIAASGDVEVAGAFRLASSQDGALDLLAHGSLLTTNTSSSPHVVAPMSTGPSLVERTFDAVQPLAGFAPASGSVSSDLGSLLLHQADIVLDLFYAATGDITATGSGTSTVPLAWEITKPARVQAFRDIADLSYFGQNLAATDITSITAGRDITYTGAWQKLLGVTTGIPNLNAPENLGGLSLAGPGFFQVQAGRNLGPFVTAAGDITAAQTGQFTPDPIGTGIVTFGNTVVVGNRRMFGSENPALADPFAAGANNGLPRQGADIVALFGVGNGIDYANVIRDYVDPDTRTVPRDYLTPLAAYLQTLGLGALSKTDAWAAFQTLPAGLQRIYADKVVLSEIKLVSDPNGCCHNDLGVGFAAIDTLLPASLGYTDNFRDIDNPGQDIRELSGDQLISLAIVLAQRDKLSGTGADLKSSDLELLSRNDLISTVLKYLRPTLRASGDLDLLHATIKTLQSASHAIINPDGSTATFAVGGDITILGPGGNINAGTTAQELRSNPLTNNQPTRNRLSNSSLGILTLDNGAINIVTDANVLVNQSRILTVQGGDILMWSSNGNLDAGRGAKTTVDFKPLSVIFSPADLQTINLNGLVSGAGIGTIRSTPDAPSASTALIASRGIVNAGDAGLRSSGNLDIVALLVLNALNIASQGAVSGVPEVSSVNLSALESTSSTGGQAARIADDSVAAAANRAQNGARVAPSLITVEVLGFGDCDPESGRACAAN